MLYHVSPHSVVVAPFCKVCICFVSEQRNFKKISIITEIYYYKLLLANMSVLLQS